MCMGGGGGIHRVLKLTRTKKKRKCYYYSVMVPMNAKTDIGKQERDDYGK